MAQYIPGSPESILGLPVGGLTGQYLRKGSDADYDTQWSAGSGGGGSAEYLTDLLDVDAGSRVEGSVLVYNGTTSKFEAGPLDTRLTLTDGGAF